MLVAVRLASVSLMIPKMNSKTVLLSFFEVSFADGRLLVFAAMLSAPDCSRLLGKDDLVVVSLVVDIISGFGTFTIVVCCRNCLVPVAGTKSKSAVVGDRVMPQNSCCRGLQKGDGPRRVL
jgi:hypothetical protein